MKILMVYPEIPDTFFSLRYAIQLFGKKALFPPLGLLTIASLLPADWEKRLIDMNIRDLTDEHLRWADYVFLSGMYVQAESAAGVIARCQRLGVKTVAGGPLFTHEHFRFPGVDHFVLNEGEITLPLFLADLDAGHPKRMYESKEFADVRSTPVPSWELAELDQYASVCVQYSRGCPYMCDFCDVTALFGRRPRTKTAEQILAEIERIPALEQFSDVYFADDNLIGNKNTLKSDLLPSLRDWQRKRGSKVSFSTQVTVNLADDDVLVQMMREAGFVGIFIGLETPYEESLLASRKKQNLKRNLLENIHSLQRSGFDISAGFIVGFDTDTAEIFRIQREFIRKSGIVLALVNVLKAPTGTELYERMKREGRLVEEGLLQLQNDEATSNFVSKLDPELMRCEYSNLVDHLYSPRVLYERCRTFAEMFRPTQSAADSEFQLSSLGMLAKIFLILGVVDSGRWYFWKLLFWSAYRNRALVMVNLVNWVKAYHVRRLYQERVRRAARAARAEARSRTTVLSEALAIDRAH
jgi:radical SAM superfamily enzyme YgiQ (UPF0313 family)